MKIRLGSTNPKNDSAIPIIRAVDERKTSLNSDEEVLSSVSEVSLPNFDVKDIKNPYFKVYTARDYPDDNRKSVVLKFERPKDYLTSIVAKYNIDFDFSQEGYPPVRSDETKESKEDEESLSEWSPYIEGVLRKKDPLAKSRNFLQRLTTSAFKYRFMRLYPDALIWFELPSFLMKKGLLVNPLARPLGILPLAVVGSIKAPGLAELMAYAEDPLSEDEEVPDIDDSALDTLQIEIGNNQAVIELRCEDWRQRCKWLECMQIAMFEGKKYAGTEELSKETFKIKEQAEVDHFLEEKQPGLERQESRHQYISLGDNLWAGNVNTIRAEQNGSTPLL